MENTRTKTVYCCQTVDEYGDFNGTDNEKFESPEEALKYGLSELEGEEEHLYRVVQMQTRYSNLRGQWEYRYACPITVMSFCWWTKERIIDALSEIQKEMNGKTISALKNAEGGVLLKNCLKEVSGFYAINPKVAEFTAEEVQGLE